MYRAFQHIRNHTLYEWTNEILQVPGRTIELNLMGSRMVLTDHPENVKTIMSTKVRFNFDKSVIEISQNYSSRASSREKHHTKCFKTCLVIPYSLVR